MGRKKHTDEHIGDKYINNQGCEFTITGYDGKGRYSIIFSDNTKLHSVNYGNIKTGEVKNLNFPSVHGVGYIGYGIHPRSIKGRLTKPYSTWLGMITRCYSEKAHVRVPTYKDVEVCREWQCFQNFAEWYKDNWKDWMDITWQIDKDICVKNNKIYSPETCEFVPREINMLIIKSRNNLLPVGVSLFKKTGKYKAQYNNGITSIPLGYFNTPEEAFQAHKKAKEAHIKEIANKWKDKISYKIYFSLINYEI